jgi:surface polysaccharide O-acyltransferase-like enzyme
MTETKDRGRLLFIDNLRVFLTILVVVHHFACTYGPSGSWYYYERSRHSPASDLLLVVFLSVNSAFFMGLFFLLSGYFTPASYDRKGFGRFLRDRLLRLGLPFAVYAFLIAPCLNAALQAIPRGTSFTPWRMIWPQGAVDTGPMWFVLLLLVFDVAYACCRLLGRQPSGKKGFQPPGDPQMLLFTLGLFAISFLVRIWFPQDRWVTVLGLLRFEPAHLPQYASFFSIGILAYRGDWFQRLSERLSLNWLGRAGIALAIFMLGMLYFGNQQGEGSGGGHSPFLGGLRWQSLLYLSYEVFMAIGMSAGLLVVFRRFFDRQGGLLRSMSADAFSVYFLHPPLIVALAYAFRNLEYDPLLKFGLASVLGVPLCFLAAEALRRLPGFGRLLAPPAGTIKTSES